MNSLISKNIPQLTLHDSVAKALQLMDDFEVTELSIVQKDKYIGTINKEDALSGNETAAIETLQDDFTINLVLEQDHFTKALSIIAEKKLSSIAVLNNDRDYIGVILATELTEHVANYIGAFAAGGIVTLSMESINFSFSEISRLIETHDATITQLNTETDVTTGLLQVTIKVNKKEISDIIATLQRFEYNVIAYYGEENYTNELQENYSHLMHYLNL